MREKCACLYGLVIVSPYFLCNYCQTVASRTDRRGLILTCIYRHVTHMQYRQKGSFPHYMYSNSDMMKVIDQPSLSLPSSDAPLGMLYMHS